MGCPSKGMSHQPIDTSVMLTTLMQERFSVHLRDLKKRGAAKRERMCGATLVPREWHRSDTGL
jgi:hypothetical protein